MRSILRFLSCLCFVGLLAIGVLATPPALAAPDPTRQPAIETMVSLGTSGGDLQFVPDRLEFIAGRRYKLVLTNPSSQKHYFTAKDFADALWTQKVDTGKVEVKGAVHELELRPGARAEWLFLPLKSGEYELHCSIPGHREAGMVGKILIAVE